MEDIHEIIKLVNKTDSKRFFIKTNTIKHQVKRCPLKPLIVQDDNVNCEN